MTTLSVQPIVDTVRDILVRISKTTRIPVQRQQLLFAGQELPRDGRPLVKHGVVGHSTLHLVKRGEDSACVVASVV